MSSRERTLGALAAVLGVFGFSIKAILIKLAYAWHAIGSLGPVFTIGLGAAILGEAIRPIQLAGAALVLVGVMLVTLRPARLAGVSSARTTATATHRRWT